MAQPSFTHKWIPRIEPREKNLFVEEYYSSTDVQITMEGEEQFEIGYIQYSLQEQLKPLYGYASRTFDDVAVGNRIVTGTFTVPIKNPEVQTSLDDILRTQEEDWTGDDSYNDDQSNLQEGIDWISGGSGGYKPPTSSVEPTTEEPNPYDYGGVSDEDLVYSQKLQTLGYDYGDNTLTTYAFMEQVHQFQKTNNMEVGDFNDATKKKIDELFANSGQETVTLPAGTKIYEGPSTGHDVVTTLTEQTVVTIVEEYNEDWLVVMTPDGTTGYVEGVKR